MIKLNKLSKPNVLEVNEKVWVEQLARRKKAGEEPTLTEKSRYRHPDIKEILLKETSGKCAYCESKLEHITYGDVEHISPKSVEPDLIFRWDNLTLACDVCNTNKGSKFPRKVGLVDPYVNDPDLYFDFQGPMIIPKLKNYEATLTEKELDLNRMSLIERRKEKVKYLGSLVEVAISAPDSLRPALIAALAREYAADQEYSALAKKMISEYLRIYEQGLK